MRNSNRNVVLTVILITCLSFQTLAQKKIEFNVDLSSGETISNLNVGNLNNFIVYQKPGSHYRFGLNMLKPIYFKKVKEDKNELLSHFSVGLGISLLQCDNYYSEFSGISFNSGFSLLNPNLLLKFDLRISKISLYVEYKKGLYFKGNLGSGRNGGIQNASGQAFGVGLKLKNRISIGFLNEEFIDTSPILNQVGNFKDVPINLKMVTNSINIGIPLN